MSDDWKHAPVITAAGVLEGYRARTGDKCLVVTFAFQELDKATVAEIIDMQSAALYIFLCRRQITNADIVENMPDPAAAPLPAAKNQKSKSKQLRDALFNYKIAQDGEAANFEEFYQGMMDKFIAHINGLKANLK